MLLREGCGSGEWECNDGQCINADYLCDEYRDCRDESDESNSRCGGGNLLRCTLHPLCEHIIQVL